MASESSEPRRLANLPGYDTSPDIYETPDLTDDTATTLRSPASDRGPSEASDTSEEDDDDDDESYGISRRRLYPERARHRFGATSARVETRGVDLSDRVDGRRKGYGVRRKAGGVKDEEDESLDQRIARLKREIEECKAEAEKKRTSNDEAEEDEEDRTGGDWGGLSRLLASVEVPVASALRKKAASLPLNSADAQVPGGVEDISEEQLLGRVTAFDSRLATLEQILGTSSLDLASPEITSTPLLPTIALLDHQLSALTSATSLSSLEAASTRIATLRRDAHDLAASQSDPEATHLSQDDLGQLRALYTLLPNLQALSTTVPSMIARLRSLRTLHTTAAHAARELDEVEKRQTEMDKELQAWRQGLEGVSAAVTEASEANGKNGRFVQGWVQDLETRMKTLGR